MLKKIALIAALIALPLIAGAQTKFGHVNSQEIITLMPEFTKANADLEAMAKQYQDEMQRTEEEFNKKYQEFLVQKKSLPANIAERREKELNDMYQRQRQFQQEAKQSMTPARDNAMTPTWRKLDGGIQTVGQAEGVIYIFDIARTPLAYIGKESIDLTAKVKAQLGIQ